MKQTLLVALTVFLCGVILVFAQNPQGGYGPGSGSQASGTFGTNNGANTGAPVVSHGLRIDEPAALHHPSFKRKCVLVRERSGDDFVLDVQYEHDFDPVAMDEFSSLNGGEHLLRGLYLLWKLKSKLSSR